MLHKTLRIIFLSFLLNLTSCSHGPRLTICPSDPSLSQFECSDSKGNHSVISFNASKDLVVYPDLSLQSVLDYCAKRNQAGSSLPGFISCSSNPFIGGMSCLDISCEVNSNENGLNCVEKKPSFVAFEDSSGYTGLSPSDNKTLLDYCNITIGD